MCEICLSSPCVSGCPNAPEPEAVFTCKVCDEPIEVGYGYYKYDDDYYHEECFEENAVKLLMEDCGAEKGVASADDIDDGSDSEYEYYRDKQFDE